MSGSRLRRTQARLPGFPRPKTARTPHDEFNTACLQRWRGVQPRARRTDEHLCGNQRWRASCRKAWPQDARTCRRPSPVAPKPSGNRAQVMTETKRPVPPNTVKTCAAPMSLIPSITMILATRTLRAARPALHGIAVSAFLEALELASVNSVAIVIRP